MTTTTAARTRLWTYADYCRIPPDRKRHEIIDGRHFVNPAPDPYHQWVSGELFRRLAAAVTDAGLGVVYHAPIDVHLSPGTIVQPDLIVLRKRNRSIVGDKKLTGVPDMLIEILSPSNRRYDQRVKRDRYERAGVREYWIVDPEAHSVEQLVLRRGAYVALSPATDRIALRILRGVTIDLGEVW
jgi:Uma2 family endonuclease